MTASPRMRALMYFERISGAHVAETFMGNDALVLFENIHQMHKLCAGSMHMDEGGWVHMVSGWRFHRSIIDGPHSHYVHVGTHKESGLCMYAHRGKHDCVYYEDMVPPHLHKAFTNALVQSIKLSEGQGVPQDYPKIISSQLRRAGIKNDWWISRMAIDMAQIWSVKHGAAIEKLPRREWIDELAARSQRKTSIAQRQQFLRNKCKHWKVIWQIVAVFTAFPLLLPLCYLIWGEEHTFLRSIMVFVALGSTQCILGMFLYAPVWNVYAKWMVRSGREDAIVNIPFGSKRIAEFYGVRWQLPDVVGFSTIIGRSKKEILDMKMRAGCGITAIEEGISRTYARALYRVTVSIPVIVSLAENTVMNMIWSWAGRQGKKPEFECQQDAVDEFVEFWRSHLVPGNGVFPTADEVGWEYYVGTRDQWTPEKKERFRALRKEYDVMDDYNLELRLKAGHVKIALEPKVDKPPRAITAPHHEIVAMYGPIFNAIYNVMKKDRPYSWFQWSSGTSCVEMGKMATIGIDRLIQDMGTLNIDGDVHYFCLDFKKFDSCQSPYIFEMLGETNAFQMPNHAANLKAYHGRNAGRWKAKFRSWRDTDSYAKAYFTATRASGDPDTTCGNTTVVEIIVRFLRKKLSDRVGIEVPMFAMGAGDDLFIALPEKFKSLFLEYVPDGKPEASILAPLGFGYTGENSANIADIDYNSKYALWTEIPGEQNQLVFYPMIGRILGISPCESRKLSSLREFFSSVYHKSTGMALNLAYLEPIATMYTTIAKNAQRIVGELSPNIRADDHYYSQRDYAEQGYRLTMDGRYDLAARYGLSIASFDAWVAEFSLTKWSFGTPPVCDNEISRKFVARDVSEFSEEEWEKNKNALINKDDYHPSWFDSFLLRFAGGATMTDDFQDYMYLAFWPAMQYLRTY